MEFLHSNDAEIPVGEFNRYDGHPDKSSQIKVLPIQAVIMKDKQGRRPEKSLQEFYALNVWHDLLKVRNEGSSLTVSSPFPYGIDTNHRIYMAFAPGLTGNDTLSFRQNSASDIANFNKKRARVDFLTHMGRLMRIKDLEGLVHSDFQLRHVLYAPAENNSMLSVIDVENSTGNANPADEHVKMRQQMDQSFNGSARMKKVIDERLEEGYYSPIDNATILPDIVEAVRARLKLKKLVL